MINQIVGTWLRLAGDRGWQETAVASIVTALLILSLLLLYRVRSRRRWKAALDAYANRQLGFDQIKNPSVVPISR